MITLKRGGVVDCIVPAFQPKTAAELKEILTKMEEFLKSLDLIMRYEPDATAEHILYANTDEKRAQAAARAFTSLDSTIIWPLLGGYGTSLILPRLRELLGEQKVYPKLLIGFSDITALHAYVIHEFNWPTLHWNTPKRVAMNILNQESVRIFQCIMNGTTDSVTYEIKPMNNAAYRTGNISSKIFGGNLSVLCYGPGTFWGGTPEDCILFLEDVNEDAYKVDMKLHHLWQAGYYNNAKAIIIGDTTCHLVQNMAKEASLSLKALSLFANKISIPVFRMDKIGHLPYNRPLPLNTVASITTNANGTRMLNVNTEIYWE